MRGEETVSLLPVPIIESFVQLTRYRETNLRNTCHWVRFDPTPPGSQAERLTAGLSDDCSYVAKQRFASQINRRNTPTTTSLQLRLRLRLRHPRVLRPHSDTYEVVNWGRREKKKFFFSFFLCRSHIYSIHIFSTLIAAWGMSSSKISLGCCDEATDEEEHLLCAGCKFAFHYSCVKVNPTNRKPGWKCSNCSGRIRRKDDTPIRNTSELNLLSFADNVTIRSARRPVPISPPTQDLASPLTRDDVCDVVNGVFDKKMKDLVSQVCLSVSNTFREELKSIKSEISELRESMHFINKQYEEFMGEHKTAVEEVNSLRASNTNMCTQITNLNGRIIQLEQQARANNVEIQCVPETKDENPVQTVMKLVKFLNCNITEENIIKCTRIAKLDRSNPRPRSIVAQLSSPK